MTNGTGFSEISRNKDNFARYTEILRNSVLFGISIPFDLAPRNLEIFGWFLRSSEIQQFLDFLDTFPWNFRTIYPLVKWKASILKFTTPANVFLCGTLRPSLFPPFNVISSNLAFCGRRNNAFFFFIYFMWNRLMLLKCSAGVMLWHWYTCMYCIDKGLFHITPE